MRKLVPVFSLLLSLFVFHAAAQTTTAGRLTSQTGGLIPAAPFTFIDSGHPVTADGTITNAVTRWLTDAPCSGEITIRILRPGDPGILGFLALVGTAGPFDAVNGLNVLTFPGIAVKAGDLLAVTQNKSGCGGVIFSDTNDPAATVYQIAGAFAGNASLTPGSVLARSHAALAFVVSSRPNHQSGIIPVVGSAAGANNSFFRTELTLSNNSAFAMDVMMLFHPAGATTLPTDPSISVHLAPNASKNYPDVVATIGRSGLGTLEILSNAYDPLVTTRVYNDGGSVGTSGFTEELVTAYDLSSPAGYAYFSIPADLANYRVNVGVRSGSAPVTLVAVVFDADGKFVGSSPKHDYPADYFEQTTLAALLGSFPAPAGGSVQLSVQGSKPAIFYVSTTDNRTNDSSLKMLPLK